MCLGVDAQGAHKQHTIVELFRRGVPAEEAASIAFTAQRWSSTSGLCLSVARARAYPTDVKS